MGQRLLVKVNKGEERIASIYYHWSAYTLSSLMECYNICKAFDEDENINENSDIKDIQLWLIRYVENCKDMFYTDSAGGIVGGKNSEEFKRITAIYPNETFNTNVNRNDGLIAITDEGKEEIENCIEGYAYVNLDGLYIGTDCWFLNSEEDYKELNSLEDENFSIDNLPIIPNNFPYDNDVYYKTAFESINILQEEISKGNYEFNVNGLVLQIMA